MPFLFTEAVKIEKEAQKKQIYSKQWHLAAHIWAEGCHFDNYFIERIVLLDFIHRLVPQKNWGIKIYIPKNHNTHVQNSHKVSNWIIWNKQTCAYYYTLDLYGHCVAK
jgi:hypothetical protein